jgi:hypothetical protein
MNDHSLSLIPDKFACIIGGYFGPSYAVEIDATGCLIYKTMGKEYKIRKTKNVSPDSKRWNDFWAVCDQINIWGWNERYEDPETSDGYSWKVEIAYSDKAVVSSGSNEKPVSFDQFLKSVEKLIGGLEFS